MDEDIDIEEHDILENPALKTIFPDVSVIKKEIECYHIEGLANTAVSDDSSTVRGVKACPQDPTIDSTTLISQLPYVTVDVDGTELKEEVIYDLTEEPNIENNISLGRKQNSCCTKPENLEQYQPKVLLKDQSSYLGSCGRYCSDCLILFPDKITFDSHRYAKHAMERKIEGPMKERPTKKCPICNIKTDYYNLKHHMELQHNLKWKVNPKKMGPMSKRPAMQCLTCKIDISYYDSKKHIEQICKPNPSKDAYAEMNNMYYRCEVCTCYFKNLPKYDMHMTKNHGIYQEDLKKVAFTFKCDLCNSRVENNKEYNTHVGAVHLNKYNKKILGHEESPKMKPTIFKESRCVSFALKSTLFKCIQCDIHFLCTKAAMHHTKHTELLVNWKCDECSLIFKNNDQYLHEFQHKFSNEFTVYDLSVSELSRILYHCPKCTVHFTEDQYLSHYPICGTDVPSAIYCKICDILVHEDAIKSHEILHKQEKIKFTTIDADILTVQNVRIYKRRRGRAKKGNNDEFCELTKKDPKKDFGKDFELFYCDLCNSFLNRENHYFHLLKQCVNAEKRICNICGLVFTQECYSKHKDLHTSLGSFKLQDFTFLEMTTRAQICPPLPKYNKCEYCHITFISRIALASHDCTDDEYLTCHVCNIKLSDNAFKLHMSFHNYPVTREIRSQEKNTEQNNESNSISEFKSKSPQALSGQCKETSQALNHISTTVREPINEDGDSGNSSKIPLNFSDKTKAKHKPNSKSETCPLIYSCKNCGLSVDTYDMMIEHCHKHYEGNEMFTDADVSYCEECDAKFLKTCFESHESLHKQKTHFKIRNFDPYYFTSENNVWIKHVFGSMPQSLVDQIVKQSIYRSERRIKLRIIQDGPPLLTVFKCAECQCIIDELVLYKHAEKCIKLKTHKCTICGLPFISTMTRILHEKLHETLNVTVKSYRIVVFNMQEDKKFNSFFYNHKLFKLYQCRNCDGVTDKSYITKHKCDIFNIKKCFECGLLLCGAEFESHIVRHKELPHFSSNNMKVILFGDKADNAEVSSDKTKPSYSGIVYDYTYYCCNQCHVCMKKNDIPAHECAPGSSKSLCPECQLYFVSNKFKGHRKLHEDREFVQGAIKVIAFGPPSHDVENADSAKDATEAVVSKELKVANIYKCTCGLHFLDATSIATHVKSCNPKMKISRQHCFKCNLLFKPDILFTHLLIHHGDKKYTYTFEVIDMSCNYDVTNKMFNCSKCKLNFIEGNEIIAHLVDCKARNSEDAERNHMEGETNESNQPNYDFEESLVVEVDHDWSDYKDSILENDRDDFMNKSNELDDIEETKNTVCEVPAMDDDIDIEEHDVLDNPALKAIFPDISVVKREIEQYDSEGPINTIVSGSSEVDRVCPQDSTIDSTTPTSDLSDPAVDVNSLNNTQIKKKTDEPSPVAQPAATSSRCQNATQHVLNRGATKERKRRSRKSDLVSRGLKRRCATRVDNIDTLQTNNIIQEKGLKPNSSIGHEESNQFQPKVLINDLRSYLDTCGRYCYLCFILFPDKIKFDSHKRRNHGARSLKNGPIWACPLCNKSSRYDNLKLHMENIHNVTWELKYKKCVEPDTMRYRVRKVKCLTCEVEIDLENLKKHMEIVHKQIWKEALSMKALKKERLTTRCPECKAEISYAKIKKHVELVHEQPWKSQIFNEGYTKKRLMRLCTICEKEFYAHTFRRHMKNKHNQTWKPIPSMPCPICKRIVCLANLEHHMGFIHNQTWKPNLSMNSPKE